MNTLTKTLLALSFSLTFLGLVFLLNKSQPIFGSAPSGLPGLMASTTAVALASRTATVVIATSTCSARVISSTDKQLMLTFSDYNNASPTGTFGLMQAASTTVVYDSGTYGCGLVKAWGDAATNITVSDIR